MMITAATVMGRTKRVHAMRLSDATNRAGADPGRPIPSCERGREHRGDDCDVHGYGHEETLIITRAHRREDPRSRWSRR